MSLSLFADSLGKESEIDELVFDRAVPSASNTRIPRRQAAPRASSAARASSRVAAPVPGDTSCFECGKKDAKLCSRCKKAYFCSVECQKESWLYHKMHCDQKSFKEIKEEVFMMTQQ